MQHGHLDGVHALVDLPTIDLFDQFRCQLFPALNERNQLVTWPLSEPEDLHGRIPGHLAGTDGVEQRSRQQCDVQLFSH